MFCPWGIDWMVVVCYWWIWCEWQLSCPHACKHVIREKKRSARESGSYFFIQDYEGTWI